MAAEAVDAAGGVEQSRAEQTRRADADDGSSAEAVSDGAGRGRQRSTVLSDDHPSTAGGSRRGDARDDGHTDDRGTGDRGTGDRHADDRRNDDGDGGGAAADRRTGDRDRDSDREVVDEGPTPARRRRGQTPLLLERWPLVVALAGLGLLTAATIDLTVDDAGSQTMILVVAGVLLVVLPLVRDRLTVAGAGASALRFELSREVAGRGAAATAQLIDRSAPGLAMAAATYGRVHATKVVGSDATAWAIRSRLLDDLVDEAAASARVHKYDADEVRQLFRDGSPVVRVLVLGLMLGDSSLTSVDTLRSAISESRSGNEQHQGLVLANRLRHRLTPSARQSLTERIRNDADIWRSATRQSQARDFVGDALADASVARFATRSV